MVIEISTKASTQNPIKFTKENINYNMKLLYIFFITYFSKIHFIKDFTFVHNE